MRDVVVAPMAGGPSTPELVLAAGRAGAFGFLAAGYKTPAAVEDEIRAVAGIEFGLNIFVPTPPPADAGAIERYRDVLRGEYERYEVEPPPLRLDDDDQFAAKVDLAVGYRVPVVSFTFGVPGAATVAALRSAGCRVLVTVTGAREARRALAAGPDGLIAQGGAAGGHAATTDPAAYTGDTTAYAVLASVRAVTDLPVVAAGGGDVPGLLAAGAAAVQCGTAFLLAEEAGTRPAQRAAMLDGVHRETVVTRAFTGQPARALRNRFTDAYSSVAPIGYPAVHHLTAPIRAEAARRGDAEALNLWAGSESQARPDRASKIIDRLQGTVNPQRSHRKSTHS
jgi:nitronate monooxygenase